MKCILIGLNHKTAPIEIREQFFLSPVQRDLLLSEFKSMPNIAEAFILSTCNRIEIYVHCIDHDVNSALFIKKLCKIRKIDYKTEWLDSFYRYDDEAAITHLLEVSAGLDSLIIGEKQILGQVKDAFERARDAEILNAPFELLAQTSIRVGKKARSETNIGIGGSSVSWAAIQLAESELKDLKDKNLLLIGTGKMGELAIDQIKKKGFKNLFLMNRTYSTAEYLAQKHGGEPVPFHDIKDIFQKVDLCICASDAPHYIIDYALMKKVSETFKRPKLILIDISMPRNIDPRISDISSMKLFHIDELNRPIQENLKKRLSAIDDVQEIIKNKLKEYRNKLSRWHEHHHHDDFPQSLTSQKTSNR